MKNIVLLIIPFLLFSCQSKVESNDLTKLNGYWEIKEVELANGEKKEYKINETIDYFELQNNIGFRQKMMPKFDGKFTTNDIKENIKITEKNSQYFIEYQTDYGKWQEEIIELADSALVLKNKEKLIYKYKRHIPFSLK